MTDISPSLVDKQFQGLKNLQRKKLAKECNSNKKTHHAALVHRTSVHFWTDKRSRTMNALCKPFVLVLGKNNCDCFLGVPFHPKALTGKMTTSTALLLLLQVVH